MSLYDIIESAKKEFLDAVKDGEDADDLINQIAESSTPMMTATTFRLVLEDSDIWWTPIENCLEGDDLCPAKVCQVAIYEHIANALVELRDQMEEEKNE